MIETLATLVVVVVLLVVIPLALARFFRRSWHNERHDYMSQVEKLKAEEIAKAEVESWRGSNL